MIPLSSNLTLLFKENIMEQFQLMIKGESDFKRALQEKNIATIKTFPTYTRKQIWSHQKLAISTIGNIHLLSIANIAFLQADSNYTRIFMKDGSTFLTSKSMKKFIEKITAPSFMRVHNRYFIQLNCIKKFDRTRCVLTLENNHEIPVSRRYKSNLMLYLKKLMV